MCALLSFPVFKHFLPLATLLQIYYGCAKTFLRLPTPSSQNAGSHINMVRLENKEDDVKKITKAKIAILMEP